MTIEWPVVLEALVRAAERAVHQDEDGVRRWLAVATRRLNPYKPRPARPVAVSL